MENLTSREMFEKWQGDAIVSKVAADRPFRWPNDTWDNITWGNITWGNITWGNITWGNITNPWNNDTEWNSFDMANVEARKIMSEDEIDASIVEQKRNLFSHVKNHGSVDISLS